jgi:hypothetical protein
MTTDQLNAFIDEHVFGVDPTLRHCTCPNQSGLCVESKYPERLWREKCKERSTWGTIWLICHLRRPPTPPDYCNDWAAFGKLVEWCETHTEFYEEHMSGQEWHVTIRTIGNINVYVAADTKPLALARAVYEAMKGKP